MNRTLSIWNDLKPFSIGFDNIFDNFDNMLEHKTINYPPYNINKIDDLNYTIEIALAGYSKKDIEVKYADNQLEIKSVHEEKDNDKETLHRGIAKRHFTRTFSIADDVVVNSAEMKDGMLIISLEKIVPEEKKPRTISIK
tara:strand:+ start:50 stop:469 length:420 start_codon:yes stop_codon:yes gene_type:complete